MDNQNYFHYVQPNKSASPIGLRKNSSEQPYPHQTLLRAPIKSYPNLLEAKMKIDIQSFHRI